MALQALWWGPICIVDVLIIVVGRSVDLVTGEGAVYNGLSHTLRHTYIYPHLIHIEPPPPIPVIWPAGSYIHVVMSGGHWGPVLFSDRARGLFAWIIN